MRLTLLVACFAATALPAAGQERPFLFSIATATDAKPAVRFDYDVGVVSGLFKAMLRISPSSASASKPATDA